MRDFYEEEIMSVLIKGMELPNICAGAVLTIYEGSDGIATAKVYNLSATDLIEIPPHGRLIDADALIEHFTLWLDDDEHYVERTFKAVAEDDIIPIIDKAPTIEADIKCEDCKTIIALKAALEPVKRGKWVEIPDEDFASTYKCSVCGEPPIVDLYSDWVFSNYCPNCGSKMENT